MRPVLEETRTTGWWVLAPARASGNRYRLPICVSRKKVMVGCPAAESRLSALLFVLGPQRRTRCPGGTQNPTHRAEGGWPRARWLGKMIMTVPILAVVARRTLILLEARIGQASYQGAERR